ncbi:MAG TPA: valine--tRNA ligase [Candidatus Acidoferrum sp.]|nr:valine--tRNA ligase [Candidatus Acidoferrum sp.]
MAREIAKAYEPQQIESHWAEFWVKEALFRADVNAPGPVFSIVIPPPNVTGSLHIGHMLDHTEIDILTRWHRMRGFNTLYLPGMDHAAISTQRVVVRQLAEKGIDYRKLGREEFEKRVWQWKQESGGKITEQMRQIGESCDWSREKFTLSPELSRVVREVFVRLYEEGLIYRGHYMTTWCPVCRTVLSDLEVVHEERQGHLWHIRFPVVGTKEFLVVATTRPETMLGDTAVAVHPADERYKHLVGKKALLPLMNRKIPIIADEMVDREFGTGAVKITPAHDPNDFEAGRRHKLPEIDVMTDDGHMNGAAGAYAGLDRFEARKKIVEDLKAQGLLEKVSEHVHAIAICERSKTIVEPRASTQWFCKMKTLAEPAIAAVERGEIRMVPENRREEYFNWMRNIRDWTLSRQLWWGHRIPAWYCAEHKHVTVAREAPAKCSTCGSGDLTQDPDVLDTWFSSGLWPFSTLGWPEKTADYEKYYPTSLLITGYDILFFWVARMIMLGIHFTGKVPFRAVYLHSLVRTASGEKMSKSKGTGLDPVALNQQYGTDAMRFCLASMAAPGTDIVLTDDKLGSARNFANKIWNAARFLFLNLDKFAHGGTTLEELAAPEVRTKAPYGLNGTVPLIDAWLFARLAGTIETVNDALSNYRFHEAAQSVYQFFWGDFCDWYIEWVKPELQSVDRERAIVAWKNLFAAFDAALQLLHPFMPFLTEELWHQSPQRPGAKSIALDKFPEAQANWKNAGALEDFGLIQEVITALRNIRAEMKLDAKRKVAADCVVQNPYARDLIQANLEPIRHLATLSEFRFPSISLNPSVGVMRSTPFFELQIAFGEGVNKQAEIARLKKEIERLEKDIELKRERTQDQDFINKAPKHVVENLGIAMVERQIEQKKLKDRLAQLEKGS